MHNTPVRLRLKPHQVRPFSMDEAVQNGVTINDLDLLGVQFPEAAFAALRGAYPGFSMDAAAFTA
jgi:hypothetical protein